VKTIIKKVRPSQLWKSLARWRQGPKGPWWGGLRRLCPVSSEFGFDRGQPIDRYYIENFLQQHAADIRGHVLEIGDDGYTRRFGVNQVSRSEVLHAVPGNPQATLVGNLETGQGLPSGEYSCMILTQTFPCLYEVRKAISHCHLALATGGVLLATLPGICQISRYDMDRWGDFWRFTSLSARRLFSEAFGEAQVKVETFGNVLAAIAFLHGLAVAELRPEELDYHDPDYEVTITVRAVKAPGGS
jgi:hypothetical protein